MEGREGSYRSNCLSYRDLTNLLPVCTSQTCLLVPPLPPSPSGLLGASIFLKCSGSTVLISLALCGFHSLRLTFQHHISICFSASKILLTPSLYPFGCMPFVSLCFHFRGVSGLDLSYLIRSPII